MNERSLADLGARITSFRGERGVSVGVVFRCPTCPDDRRHSVIATWAGPSLYESGAAWNLESAPEVAVLTLTPSINLDVPYKLSDRLSEEEKRVQEANRCRFHGWVREGKVLWP